MPCRHYKWRMVYPCIRHCIVICIWYQSGIHWERNRFGLQFFLTVWSKQYLVTGLIVLMSVDSGMVVVVFISCMYLGIVFGLLFYVGNEWCDLLFKNMTVICIHLFYFSTYILILRKMLPVGPVALRKLGLWEWGPWWGRWRGPWWGTTRQWRWRRQWSLWEERVL